LNLQHGESFVKYELDNTQKLNTVDKIKIFCFSNIVDFGDFVSKMQKIASLLFGLSTLLVIFPSNVLKAEASGSCFGNTSPAAYPCLIGYVFIPAGTNPATDPLQVCKAKFPATDAALYPNYSASRKAWMYSCYILRP
jgi:hypothetical protein